MRGKRWWSTWYSRPPQSQATKNWGKPWPPVMFLVVVT